MRGGFVACFGGAAGNRVEALSEELRWHRGTPVRYSGHGLEAALLTDPKDGPFIEETDRGVVLSHGLTPAPLTHALSSPGRFTVLEVDGESLRVGRDLHGDVPVFYRHLEGATWFATEVRPLLKLAPAVPDLEQLARLVALVEEVGTGWVGIYRVPPGCVQGFKPGPQQPRMSWDAAATIDTFSGTREEALAQFRDLFAAATMRATDGAGVLLSGGLDSSAVAMMRARLGMPQTLVHIWFPDHPECDERTYAEAVAATAGEKLHVVRSSDRAWDVDDDFETHCTITQIPFPGSLVDGLEELRRLGIEVGDDGHHADEALGIRDGILGALAARGQWGELLRATTTVGPLAVARSLSGAFLPEFMHISAYRPPEPSYPLAAGSRTPYGAAFTGAIGQELGELGRPRFGSRSWRSGQLDTQAGTLALATENAELIAAKIGVDVRHPFGDRDLTGFLMSLPPEIKADASRSKAFLRDALDGVLPSVIRDRTSKPAFDNAIRARVDIAGFWRRVWRSETRLPGIDYQVINQHVEAHAETIDIGLLTRLTSAHALLEHTA